MLIMLFPLKQLEKSCFEKWNGKEILIVVDKSAGVSLLLVTSVKLNESLSVLNCVKEFRSFTYYLFLFSPGCHTSS